ncbi:MAG: prolipoprotein diacylglyceryl transferase [Clostridia bacterium]|nr:prolipoprotein diacylglyceryl transferase [Clostridia bacterium]
MLHESQEIRSALYSNLNAISWYIMILYQLLCIKQKRNIPSYCVEAIERFFGNITQCITASSPEIKGIKKILSKITGFLSKDYIWLIAEVYILISFVQYDVSGTVAFGKLFGTGANYFAIIYNNVVIYLLICIIIGINPLKQMDWITPSYPLALIFAKLGCFFAGCCNGMEMENGLYNYRYERYEFPSQLLEIFWALAIFIFFMFYKKKAKRGTLYPIYLILFGATRFVGEFLRFEEDIVGPFKTYHFLCFSAVVIGIVLLIFVKLFGDDIDKLFDKKYRGVIGFAVKKVKGINDDDTYTEKGQIRADKINELKNKLKAKKDAKSRKNKKRKEQVKF